MLMWIRGWASLMTLLVLCGCASSDGGAGEATFEVAEPAGGLYAERLAALEARIGAVATKRAWSGHYFREGPVTGASVQGTDLLVTVFNANTRRHEAHCVDTVRGGLRWMVDLGDTGLKHPPMAGDRWVVFVLDQGQGMVVVKRSNGAREFRWTTPLSILPAGPAGSSESTVYVASLVDNRVHALNPDTGMSGWHWRSLGTLTGGLAMTPRLPRRLVVAGSDEGELFALPATAWNEVPPEKPVWQRRMLGDVTAPIAVSETISATGHDVSLVVPCEDKGLYCLDGATGDTRWVIRTDQPFRAAPQIAGGKVFARNLGRLVVADLATGAQPWMPSAEDQPAKAWEGCSGVYAADDRRTYLACEGKKVCRADSKSGVCLACESLDAFDWILPATSGNVLLGVTADGYIVAGS